METKTTDSDGKTIQELVSTEQQNSMEIACNAKGDYSFKVKVYSDDIEEMEAKLKKYVGVAKAIIKEGSP